MNLEQFPSKLLERAVSETAKLPGVGRKSALRLVLHLLRKDAQQTHTLAESLVRLRDDVRYCRCCHNISDNEMCDTPPYRTGILATSMAKAACSTW